MPVKILTASTARSYIIFIHKLMFFCFEAIFELKRNGSMSSFRNSAQILKLCKRRLFMGCLFFMAVDIWTVIKNFTLKPHRRRDSGTKYDLPESCRSLIYLLPERYLLALSIDFSLLSSWQNLVISIRPLKTNSESLLAYRRVKDKLDLTWIWSLKSVHGRLIQILFRFLHFSFYDYFITFCIFELLKAVDIWRLLIVEGCWYLKAVDIWTVEILKSGWRN